MGHRADFTRHCRFSWIERSGERVVIRDTCDSTRPTVTNDAKWLVESFLDGRVITPGVTRLFYFDTDDRLDEIVFDQHGFVRFAPGPEEMQVPR